MEEGLFMNLEYMTMKNDLIKKLEKLEPFYRFIQEDVLNEAEKLINKQEDKSKENYGQLVMKIIESSDYPKHYLGLQNMLKGYQSN